MNLHSPADLPVYRKPRTNDRDPESKTLLHLVCGSNIGSHIMPKRNMEKSASEGVVDKLMKRNLANSSSKLLTVNKVSNVDPKPQNNEEFEKFLKLQLAALSRNLMYLCDSVEGLESKVTDIQSRVSTLHQEFLYRASTHDE